ncbi:MAG: metallophosphoesterase [Candidatus Thorarchaeota archaeon]|jgi:3',5'-cyclic AMP phosphodiesterase CpdA
MRKYLSILVVSSLLLLPMIGTIGFQNSSSSLTNSHIVSDIVDFERGPTVNLVTNNSATIFWRTDTLTDSTVNYGVNTSILESVSNSTLVNDHYMILNGLEMDTKYYYKVSSGSDESETYFFHTAPADGEEFRFILAGDNRPSGTDAPTQPAVFSDIADMIIDEEPHLVILLGDFVYRVTGSESADTESWRLFTDISDRIGHYAPVIGVIGNHDTGAHTGSAITKYFLDAFVNAGTNTTYFSIEYAGVHLAILDSEEYGLTGRITGEQYDWLVNDLAEAGDKMKFAFSHQPLYPATHIDSSLDVNKTERDRLQNLFEEENVTLYGCGHDHSYSHLLVNGVFHMTTGGLGAPPYFSPWSLTEYHYVRTNVSANAIDLEVVTIDDDIADTFHLPYDGPILITLRGLYNTSTAVPGTLPEILFSETPETEYYSWDGAVNSSSLTGFPAEGGNHTLEVFVENDEGVWSYAKYIFETNAPEPTDTTPTTPTQPLTIDPILLIGLVGAVVVVVIIVVVKIKKR